MESFPVDTKAAVAGSEKLGDQIARAYYQTTAGRGHARTREHYDSFMPSYGRRLVRWLPADKSTPCVDLACGCGEFLYSLQTVGYTDLCGVDACREELDEARHFVHARLVHSDLVDYLRATPDASIGFLSALNVLEHLPKDILPEVLRQARRVLRPGGTLLAIVPNAMSPFASIARYWDVSHELSFSPNSVRQLAALVGFSDQVDFDEVGPIPHGLKSVVRWGLWRVLRMGIKGWLLIESGAVRGTVFTQDMILRLHRD
jgi:SAM-dependent methyltransferase